MKTTLFCALSVLLLLTACERDETNLNPDPREVKYNISLSDKNILDQSHLDSNTPGNPPSAMKLSDYFSRLEYYLYDSDGKKVAQQNFDADASATGFTIPASSLKPGKYTAVFLGRQEKNVGTSTPLYNGDDQNAPYLLHSTQRELTDLFFASQEFDVKKDDIPVDISLKRPGGKVKVVIEDEWPQNVEKMVIAINGFTVYYPKSDKLDQRQDIYLPVTKSTALANGTSTPQQTNVECSYENFIYTNSSDITRVNATVIAYDKAEHIIAKRPMQDIKVERNKLTTLKIRLFEGIASGE